MTTLPQHFHRIRLNLARSKEFPDGSSRHGYEFVEPLDATGHIDTVLWKQHRALCTVRRIWAGEADLNGLLVHKAGGDRGGTWIFDYDGTSDFDDEAGYRFGAHAMQIGEYVSIKDEDGVLHTFIVTSLDAV